MDSRILEIDEKIKNLERQMKAETKKVSKGANLHSVIKTLHGLEHARSTDRNMSLADEKLLIKKMEKCKLEKKTLENIEQLRKDRDAMRRQREDIEKSLTMLPPKSEPVCSEPSRAMLRKQSSMDNKRENLLNRIFETRGGQKAPDGSELIEEVSMISKDRIGQFVGKLGSNLTRLEETYCVSLDVSSEGEVAILGLREDVSRMLAEVREFENQITQEFVITKEQYKLLRGNRGNLLKSFEAKLGVMLVLFTTGQGTSNPVSYLKVRGSPEILARVPQELNEIVSCTKVLKVDPGNPLLRNLLANNGSELHNVENRCDVCIFVERDTGVITITGTDVNVGGAMSVLGDIAKEQHDEEEVVEIELDSPDIASVIIGRKGLTVKRLQAETGVQILVKKNTEENSNIEKAYVILKAPSSKLPAARAAVDQIVEQYWRENVTLAFPEVFHSALYGQGGAVIRRIQEQSGTTIGLQRRETRTDGVINVFIRGDSENVQRAVDLLNGIIAEQNSTEIPVPDYAKSALIGQKGSVISKMQKETGANISVQDGKALIRGTKEQVTAAIDQILQVLREFDRENLVLYVHPAMTGTLIGKGGTTLRRLRESSGTHIEVNVAETASATENNQILSHEKPTDLYGEILPACIVKIRGDDASIAHARELIEELVENRIIPEHEKLLYREKVISLPSMEAKKQLLEGDIIANIEAQLSVETNVDRDSNFVRIRGKAGPDILEAEALIRKALHQESDSIEVLKDVAEKLANLLVDTELNWINRIEMDSGVRLKLFRDESSQNNNWTLQIQGPRVNIDIAKELLRDVFEGFDWDIVPMPLEYLRYLNHGGPESIENVCKKNGATVTVDLTKQCLRIRGSNDSIQNCRLHILEILQSKFSQNVVEISLSSGAILATVIGKRGATIRKLQSDFDVNVYLDKENPRIFIVGTETSAVQSAKVFVLDIIEAWERENVSFTIPREAIPMIIGVRGSTIQNIKNESGVRLIDLDRDHSLVKLRGEAEALEIATRMIQEIVAHFHRMHDTVTIAQEEVPWLIGTRGSTIRGIQEMSGAQCQIEKGSNVIHLRGSEESVEIAKAEIDRIVGLYREQKARSLENPEDEDNEVEEQVEAVHNTKSTSTTVNPASKATSWASVAKASDVAVAPTTRMASEEEPKVNTKPVLEPASVQYDPPQESFKYNMFGSSMIGGNTPVDGTAGWDHTGSTHDFLSGHNFVAPGLLHGGPDQFDHQSRFSNQTNYGLPSLSASPRSEGFIPFHSMNTLSGRNDFDVMGMLSRDRNHSSNNNDQINDAHLNASTLPPGFGDYGMHQSYHRSPYEQSNASSANYYPDFGSHHKPEYMHPQQQQQQYRQQAPPSSSNWWGYQQDTYK